MTSIDESNKYQILRSYVVRTAVANETFIIDFIKIIKL